MTCEGCCSVLVSVCEFGDVLMALGVSRWHLLTWLRDSKSVHSASAVAGAMTLNAVAEFAKRDRLNLGLVSERLCVGSS